MKDKDDNSGLLVNGLLGGDGRENDPVRGIRKNDDAAATTTASALETTITTTTVNSGVDGEEVRQEVEGRAVAAAAAGDRRREQEGGAAIVVGQPQRGGRLGRSRGRPRRDGLPVANPIDTSNVPVAYRFREGQNYIEAVADNVDEEADKKQHRRRAAALAICLLAVMAAAAIGLGVGLTVSNPTDSPSPETSNVLSTSRPSAQPITATPTISMYPSASPTVECAWAYQQLHDCVGYNGTTGQSDCEVCIRTYFLDRLDVDLSIPLTIICTQVNDEACAAIASCSVECLDECASNVMSFVACTSLCPALDGYNCTGTPPYTTGA